jgi:hypothetical protein
MIAVQRTGHATDAAGGQMTEFLRWVLVAASVALGAAVAEAQTYPGKPIRVIVSTSPGGITDIAARVLGAHITARTGQPVVIDNRPGASGTIALEAVTHAAPDGYTLGFANTGNITINPSLFAHLPFDPLSDLIPVGPIGTVPLFLVINGKMPATTLAEFIAYAKANPDTVNYAGAGAGTTPDLAGLEFMRRAGLKLVMVPFKGTAPATTAATRKPRSSPWVRIWTSCAPGRCACWPPPRPDANPICRTPRHSRSWDFRASRPRPGSLCSRRAAPRPRSSSGSTSSPARCMRTPNRNGGWTRTSSIR